MVPSYLVEDGLMRASTSIDTAIRVMTTSDCGTFACGKSANAFDGCTEVGLLFSLSLMQINLLQCLYCPMFSSNVAGTWYKVDGRIYFKLFCDDKRCLRDFDVHRLSWRRSLLCLKESRMTLVNINPLVELSFWRKKEMPIKFSSCFSLLIQDMVNVGLTITIFEGDESDEFFKRSPHDY